jgi:hypothetical protein
LLLLNSTVSGNILLVGVMDHREEADTELNGRVCFESLICVDFPNTSHPGVAPPAPAPENEIHPILTSSGAMVYLDSTGQLITSPTDYYSSENVYEPPATQTQYYEETTDVPYGTTYYPASGSGGASVVKKREVKKIEIKRPNGAKVVEKEEVKVEVKRTKTPIEIKKPPPADPIDPIRTKSLDYTSAKSADAKDEKEKGGEKEEVKSAVF